MSFLVFFLDFVFTRATLVIAYSIQYFSSSSGFIILFIVFYVSFLVFVLDFVFTLATLVIAYSIQYFSSSVFIIYCILCVISRLCSRFCIYTCYIGNYIQYTVFLFFVCIYYFMYFMCHFSYFF